MAQVKEKCGIKERENYNKSKYDDSKQPICLIEKEDAIKLQRKKEQKNLIRDEIISNKGRTPKRKNKINSTKKTSN